MCIQITLIVESPVNPHIWSVESSPWALDVCASLLCAVPLCIRFRNRGIWTLPWMAITGFQHQRSTTLCHPRLASKLFYPANPIANIILQKLSREAAGATLPPARAHTGVVTRRTGRNMNSTLHAQSHNNRIAGE